MSASRPRSSSDLRVRSLGSATCNLPSGKLHQLHGESGHGAHESRVHPLAGLKVDNDTIRTIFNLPFTPALQRRAVEKGAFTFATDPREFVFMAG